MTDAAAAPASSTEDADTAPDTEPTPPPPTPLNEPADGTPDVVESERRLTEAAAAIARG